MNRAITATLAVLMAFHTGDAVAQDVFAGTLAATCARVTGPPLPKGQAFWFTMDDYPSAALRKEIGAVVKYRVFVGTNGRPTRVRILKSTPTDNLAASARLFADVTSKLLLRRANFQPAVRRCIPVTSRYDGSITWAVPAE